jgi:hypothetical protein
MIKPMLLVAVLPNPPVHQLPKSDPRSGSLLRPRLRLLAVMACWLAALHLSRAAAPVNDVCLGAQTISGSGTFPLLTLPIVDATDATVSPNDPPLSNPDLAGKVAKSVWFRFTPSAAAVYTVSTCTDAGTATTIEDTILAIYRSSGGCSGPFTQVGMLGDEDCGANGSQAAVTAGLSADTTYYIVVWKYCDNCIDDGMNLLQLLVDGNLAPPNDSCTNATPIQLNIPVTGSTVGAANNYELSGTNGFGGLNQNPSPARGRDAVFSFLAPQTDTYSIKALNYDVNQDVVVYVLTNCPAAGGTNVLTNALAAANRSRVNSAEEIRCLPLVAGQRIFIVVDDNNVDNPGSTFTLEVTVCQSESEPNDEPAKASPLFCGVEGTISPSFDLDFYALGSFPAGWRAFALVDGEAARNQDFDLRITTSTDTIEYDNDDNDAAFGDSSPNIAGTPLLGGPAFALVGYNGNLREAEPYRLFAVVQPPLEQAAQETEPNDDFMAPNFDDRNYFYGTLSGPAPSTDVDVFGFSVSEGDLIFLSLDTDPHRTNSPMNARLELLDASGNPVLSVNDRDSSSFTNGLPGFFPASPSEGLVYRSPVEGAFFARISISPTAAGTEAMGDYLLSISKNCYTGPFGQNHAPVLTNLAVSVPVTTGVPATLSGNIWEQDAGDAVNLEISWGDGATNQLDYLGGGWLDCAQTHVYSGVNVNRTITVTARDREGNVATDTRTVLVHPHPQAARFVSITPLGNGRYGLVLQGTANGFYRIDQAEVLGSWSALTTATADATGRITFNDPTASPTSRFYRAVGVE